MKQDLLDSQKVDQWAARIAGAWNAAREAYFEAGRLLLEAKADCVHGEWMALVGDKQHKGELPFGYDTAIRLMRVAEFGPFQSKEISQVLPNSYRAIDDLRALANKRPKAFQKALDDGVVRPDARYIDIKHWIKKEAREQKHQDIAKAGQTQTGGGEMFNLVYADPPWEFKTYSDKGKDMGPAQHYPELSDEGICRFKYGDRWIGDCLADDCLLFLWCTPANLVRALAVMEAWGFEYRSHMVWVKDKVGQGFYARQMHEPLLIGVRGAPPMPIEAPPSAIAAPRAQHSAKPAIFRETLETMYPHFTAKNRIELFARSKHSGWTVYGHEAH